MATANAMSVQMTLQNVSGDTQKQVAAMPCHDMVSQQDIAAQGCIGCGFCVIASSVAYVDTTPFLDIPTFVSFKSSSVDVALISADQTPAFRPPIRN